MQTASSPIWTWARFFDQEAGATQLHGLDWVFSTGGIDRRGWGTGGRAWTRQEVPRRTSREMGHASLMQPIVESYGKGRQAPPGCQAGLRCGVHLPALQEAHGGRRHTGPAPSSRWRLPESGSRWRSPDTERRPRLDKTKCEQE